MNETRSSFLFGFLSIISILLFSFYLQYVKDIFPCPLCELQRIIFLFLGCFFLIGTTLYHKRWVRYSTWFFLILTSILGALIAANQVWIQHFPHTAKGVCGASLTHLLKIMPLRDVAAELFAGNVECTRRGWEFLKLDLAEWSLLLFIAFSLYSLFHLVKEWRQKV